MSTTKEIVKRVDTRNKKAANKNVRIANAIEGIFDLVVDMEEHVKSMGMLDCIKNIDNYTPETPKMEEISNAIWMIAQSSTDSYEEAVGVITCAQHELQMEFGRLNDGRVEMDGFIKNRN